MISLGGGGPQPSSSSVVTLPSFSFYKPLSARILPVPPPHLDLAATGGAEGPLPPAEGRLLQMGGGSAAAALVVLFLLLLASGKDGGGKCTYSSQVGR